MEITLSMLFMDLANSVHDIIIEVILLESMTMDMLNIIYHYVANNTIRICMEYHPVIEYQTFSTASKGHMIFILIFNSFPMFNTMI